MQHFFETGVLTPKDTIIPAKFSRSSFAVHDRTPRLTLVSTGSLCDACLLGS